MQVQKTYGNLYANKLNCTVTPNKSINFSGLRINQEVQGFIDRHKEMFNPSDLDKYAYILKTAKNTDKKLLFQKPVDEENPEKVAGVIKSLKNLFDKHAPQKTSEEQVLEYLKGKDPSDDTEKLKVLNFLRS